MNIPNVHENDREIPNGKVLIADRLDRDAPRARPVVLDTRTAWGGTTVELVACVAGWACAGSVMRWDNGWYGYRFEHYGTRGSRRFRSFDEAHEAFSKLPA